MTRTVAFGLDYMRSRRAYHERQYSRSFQNMLEQKVVFCPDWQAHLGPCIPAYIKNKPTHPHDVIPQILLFNPQSADVYDKIFWDVCCVNECKPQGQFPVTVPLQSETAHCTASQKYSHIKNKNTTYH